MMLADTGYFIALARRRDVLHGRAAAWAVRLTAARTPILVTESVLWEVVNELSAPLERAKAHQFVAMVRGGGQYVFIPTSPQLFDAGLALHAARPDKEWSLTDCVSFHLLRERGLTQALAHDNHFAQAGFDPLLQHDP